MIVRLLHSQFQYSGRLRLSLALASRCVGEDFESCEPDVCADTTTGGGDVEQRRERRN